MEPEEKPEKKKVKKVKLDKDTESINNIKKKYPFKALPRITAFNWQLCPYKAENGLIFIYLNKLYKGRVKGCILMSKRELRNLKIFLNDREGI